MGHWLLIVLAAWLALSFALTVAWCIFVEASRAYQRHLRTKSREIRVMSGSDREFSVQSTKKRRRG